MPYYTMKITLLDGVSQLSAGEKCLLYPRVATKLGNNTKGYESILQYSGCDITTWRPSGGFSSIFGLKLKMCDLTLA
jgi:hypothetical protein